MAPLLLLVLVLGLTASLASGSLVRIPRDLSGAISGAGAGSFAGSGASSGSFSSSSDTKVAPGPGGYGNFNAFAANTNLNRFADEGETPPYHGPAPLNPLPRPTPTPFPFFFPPFNPYVPQYGQQFPFVPFPTFAPFDFSAFLGNYFQQLQQFQTQAEAQAQQAAASGHGIYHKGPNSLVYAYSYPRSFSTDVPYVLIDSGYPTDTNEVGAGAIASYSPQGGYGSANVFPAPPGGLETRFGGDFGAGSPNAVGGGPISSVSGSFTPPGSNSFGVFSSSMSGSSDINGKKTSFKQSTVGVNDNGKVTTYTAHDP